VLAAAASVVVIAGAVAVASGVGRPAAAPGPAGSDLPPAHVLDQAAWNAATTGWVDGWSEPGPDSQMAWADGFGDPACMDAMPDTGTPEPKRQGQLVLVTEGHQLTFGVLGDFDAQDPADKTWTAIHGAFSGCTKAERLQTLTWAGAEAESYRLPSGKGDAYLWTAHEGSAIALFWTVGVGTDLPQDTDTAVLTAMVAGMQDPDSYKGADLVTGHASGEASGDSSAVATPSGSIDEAEFAQALGTWDSGWERAGTKVVDLVLPCLGEDVLQGQSGFGTSVGSNGGYYASSFGSDAEATTGRAQLVSALGECSAAYDVRTVGSDPAVTVAKGGVGIVWIAQVGNSVGYVAVQTTTRTAPPDEVSLAVGKLLAVALGTHGPPPVAVSASPR
jgi:hypothetical protein